MHASTQGPYGRSLTKLVVGGIACLVLAAALACGLGPSQFGLHPAADFKSSVVSVQSQRTDVDVKTESDALVRSIIIEWRKKNPTP